VIDINPEDVTSYTIQYQEASCQYMENEYCATHQRMSIIEPENVLHGNIFPSPKASGIDQSSFDPYQLSSDDEDYLTPKWVAETTPAQKWLRSTLLDSHKALFEFTAWSTKKLRAN